MSAYQVEALENGDYTRLPKGTFLKGFVRNYAKLLGLDADVMLSRLVEGSPKAPAPGIVVPSQNIRFDTGDRLSNPYVKASLLAFVVLLVGCAALSWWVAIRTTPPAAAAKKAAAEPTRASRPTPQNLAAAPVPPPEPVMVQQAPTMAEPAKAEAPKSDPP